MKSLFQQHSQRPVIADATLAVPFAGLAKPQTYVGDVLSGILLDTVNYFKQWFANWRRQRAINRSTLMLSDLSDHLLDDIGLKRYQIREAAEFIVDHPGSDRYRYLAK